jgi:hypothetical protein
VRALTATTAVLPALLSTACVDLCVLSGAPCDSHADCAEEQVCRLRRGFELGCVFAAGTCVDGDCGSAADCGEAECCHPDSNSCVAETAYTGPCDPRTCGECAECTAGFCETRGEVASCGADDDCGPDETCSFELCRAVCSYDTDCPGAICNSGACSAPYGSPCRSNADCAGLSCSQRTPAGAERAGYCTGACAQDGTCPLGFYFVCVSDECRMP